jgi:hypothetical protein
MNNGLDHSEITVVRTARAKALEPLVSFCSLPNIEVGDEVQLEWLECKEDEFWINYDKAHPSSFHIDWSKGVLRARHQSGRVLQFWIISRYPDIEKSFDIYPDDKSRYEGSPSVEEVRE